ncbi:MAG: hypothetical protein N2512_09585 [Armatimonadetes bacterium]|nr:hypothetical protein [Armatimonadota bacterium]
MTREKEFPGPIMARVEAAARRWDRPIILRAARWPDHRLRGRVSQRAGALVLEYRDDGAGYFWHLDIVNELLNYVEQGHFQVTLREDEDLSLFAALFGEAGR